MDKKYLILISTLMILLALQNASLAAALQLTLATDKPSYNLGFPITVGGNLTLNGNPVSDGLVAVEIFDPRSQMILMRTQTTGTDPPKPWTIEITQLFPCDGGGNPKTSVNQGGNIGFSVSLKNNDMSTHSVMITLYMQYSNNVPATAFVAYNSSIEGNSTQDFISYPVPIEGTAPLGTTSMYASALTDMPREGGFAYCPEKKTTFTITSSLATSVANNNEDNFISAMSSQAYSLVFAVSSHGGIIGNYTIYACSRYSFYVASDNTKFADLLTTDINGPGGKPDGKVDIMDLAFVSLCYGSYPGHGHWDPRADINKDGKVDISDVSRVSHDFGTWGILP
jgi:hypothetical protein